MLGQEEWEGILRSWWRNNLDWGYPGVSAQRECGAGSKLPDGMKDKVLVYLQFSTQTWCRRLRRC